MEWRTCPFSFCEANITLINKARKNVTSKENYRPIFLMQKSSIKYWQNPAANKRNRVPWLSLIYPRNAKLVQHMKIKSNTPCRGIKGKNHRIISVGTEKVLDKMQNPFMMKTLTKPVLEGRYLQLPQGVCGNPGAIMVTGEQGQEGQPLTVSARRLLHVPSGQQVREREERHWKGKGKTVSVRRRPECCLANL